jgi:hypothetical protein
MGAEEKPRICNQSGFGFGRYQRRRKTMERIRVGSRFGAGLLAVVAAFMALAVATLIFLPK